jgi:hypothetical protein
MARTARSNYISSDESAVCYIRCRTNRTLVLPAHHPGADALKHRVVYIEDLIRLYAGHFAISVHAHAVTRREIRLVLQSHPELISDLDDAQIAHRWLSICPTLRRGSDLSAEPSDEEIQALCKDPPRIAQIRRQLSDISWLMRLLQQRVAQLCNREGRREGRFWKSRFRAVLLLDAMSHLAALANVDLAAVRVRMGKPISASTFTSDVYRRKELQNSGDVQPSTVRSDSQGIGNDSTDFCTEELTVPPSNDVPVLALQSPDMIAGISNCPTAIPAADCSGALPSANAASVQSRDGRHLAPIFLCSEDSALNMQISAYRELIERTSLGCHPDDQELSSLNISAVLSRLQLTFDQWVVLVGEFDRLFSHVAGRLAAMDAYRPKRGGQRACVRSAARSLLRARRAC